MFYFYLFRCKDRTLYCGITNNLKRREKLHNVGRGSKYVRSRGGGAMVYNEKFRSRNKALRREAEIKKWPKQKKELLIRSTKNHNSRPR